MNIRKFLRDCDSFMNDTIGIKTKFEIYLYTTIEIWNIKWGFYKSKSTTVIVNMT